MKPRQHGHASAASGGVVIGRVRRLASPAARLVPHYRIDSDDLEHEQARFEAALQAAVTQVEQDLVALESVEDNNPSALLKAHLLLLKDAEFIDSILYQIKEERRNSHWGIQQAIKHKLKQFDAIDDPYLREMREQLVHAGSRIIGHLTPDRGAGDDIGDEEAIIVADEMPLPDVVSHWQRGVAAIVSLRGGVNNHVIVMARGIAMPALAGIDDPALAEADDGDLMILDGERKQWILHPDAHDLDHYRRFQHAILQAESRLATFANQATVTADGTRVRLMCNVEFPEELDLARRVGVDGIGLLRTEFAFLTASRAPSEQDQHRFYRRFVQAMERDKPVTMRLLDIGADKRLAFHPLGNHHYHGENPALGLRGIRLLLRAPELLRAQVRAMIRTAAEGRVQLLVPMVTHVEQMVRVRDLVADEMDAMGLHPPLPIGAMIEVPAAVMIADALAEVSDFFSIGTNDLIQYTLAADRCDDDPFVDSSELSSHPSIARMIQLAATSAQQAGTPISICGELAADPAWSQPLIAMGITTLSVNSGSILPLRRHIRRLTLDSNAPT